MGVTEKHLESDSQAPTAHPVPTEIEANDTQKASNPQMDYADFIADKLEAYCDVERDITWGGLDFDVVGTMLRRNEKFVLKKRNVLYAYNEFEYFFLYQKERMHLEELERLVKTFRELAREHVSPDEEHKTSDYCLIVSVARADEEMKRYVKKYKDRISLQWGMKGFLSTRVLLVEGYGSDAAFSKELRGKTYHFVLRKKESTGESA